MLPKKGVLEEGSERYMKIGALVYSFNLIRAPINDYGHLDIRNTLVQVSDRRPPWRVHT
jgi:hypothetical protein